MAEKCLISAFPCTEHQTIIKKKTHDQCSKLVKLIACPLDGLPSKFVCPCKKRPVHTFLRGAIIFIWSEAVCL